MPAHHQALLECSPERLLRLGRVHRALYPYWVDSLSARQRIRQSRYDLCRSLLGTEQSMARRGWRPLCLHGYLTGANRLHHIRNNTLKHGWNNNQLHSRQDPLPRHPSCDNVHGEHHPPIHHSAKGKSMQITSDEQLSTLRLGGVKQWGAESATDAERVMYRDMSFKERLQLLLSHELVQREQRKVNRLEKQARFRLSGQIRAAGPPCQPGNKQRRSASHWKGSGWLISKTCC